MPVNKVIYGSTTLIDLTDATATADKILSGYSAYGADGSKLTGTASGGGGSVSITDEANATGITCVITSGGSEPTPTETWETLYNNLKAPNADTPYNYFWFETLGDVYPTIDSVWRVTIDGTEYRCTAYFNSAINLVCFGNPKYSGGTDDGSDIPLNAYNAGWNALVADTELSVANHTIKIERLVTE